MNLPGPGSLAWSLTICATSVRLNSRNPGLAGTISDDSCTWSTVARRILIRKMVEKSFIAIPLVHRLLCAEVLRLVAVQPQAPSAGLGEATSDAAHSRTKVIP
jgi:hypothetical protein